MTRLDFFLRLREGLQKLPAEELENAVRYYAEYFDDAGAENEQKVLHELGDPMKIAQQITAEYMVRDIAIYRPQKQDGKPQGKKGISAVWVAILAVFASPIALPIAIAIAAVVFAVVITVAAILFSLYAVAISLVATGIFGAVIGFVVIPVHPPTALCAIGTGLAVAGVGLLLFLPLLALTRVTFNGIARMISHRVVRRKKV